VVSRLLAAVLLLLAFPIAHASGHPQSADRAASPGAEPTSYFCPMHPEITSTAAGSCSRCGMVLVPGDPLDFRGYHVDFTNTPKVVRPGQRVRLTFTIRHPQTGVVVRKFAAVHEKRYHLFVLSHDLEYYDHLHPEPQPDGTWTVDLTLPKAGYYKLYSDFLPIGGTPQVIPGVLVTAGYTGDLAAARAHLVADRVLRQVVGSIAITLTLPPDGLMAGREEKLQYRVDDARTGEPVTDIQPYLAAYGHTLVISEDTMQYVHAHPVELLADNPASAGGGPDLTFKALLPKPGGYRFWTQIKRDGIVYTAHFTVSVASPTGALSTVSR
jgi:hypothetical protein